MRKLAIVGLALSAIFAMAAVAIAQYAQPTMTASGKVKPGKGGSKKKPKNGYVETTFRINPESNTTIDQITYTLPKNIVLDGKGFPTCDEEQIAAEGEASCPNPSRVGTGSALAHLGSADLVFTVNVYVAARKLLVLALTHPTLGTIPFTATINGRRVAFDIPENVTNVTGNPQGPYSTVESVTAKIGKQKGIKGSVTKGKGKKRKTRFYASLTGCPKNGKHQGSTLVRTKPNPNPSSVGTLSAKWSAKCKK